MIGRSSGTLRHRSSLIIRSNVALASTGYCSVNNLSPLWSHSVSTRWPLGNFSLSRVPLRGVIWGGLGAAAPPPKKK